MEVLACLVPGVYVAYTDWTNRIINNYITFPMIILGLAYALLTKNSAGLWGFVFTFFRQKSPILKECAGRSPMSRWEMNVCWQ